MFRGSPLSRALEIFIRLKLGSWYRVSTNIGSYSSIEKSNRLGIQFHWVDSVHPVRRFLHMEFDPYGRCSQSHCRCVFSSCLLGIPHTRLGSQEQIETLNDIPEWLKR